MLDTATASHSLGEVLGLGPVKAREIYATLDWLGSEQPFIEASLARRHLSDGALVLYDVTSTYLEGRCCPLAQHGYSRDSRPDRPQLVIGLLCAADGCPVAVEVFEGNTADPRTLISQIDKLKQRFNLRRLVVVGDRGMITEARIEQTLRPAGLDWITALRATEHARGGAGHSAARRRGWAAATLALR
jgi:transposase